MCGIAGILSANPARITPERLKTMTDAIAHRGPDGEGHWVDTADGIALGHRRLSILDLSPAGSQPMHCLDRYTVIHNGEIYNHIELRNTLISKGYSFNSRTDTELIPAAYDCFGADCLQYFEGMFAFALWDRHDKSLFLARDRFGEKPLFYYRDETQFLFASEMKALWAAGVPRYCNERMLFNFLTIGYTDNPADPGETFFKEIARLPARSYLFYYPLTGKQELIRYWDPCHRVTPAGEKRKWSDGEAVEMFDSLLSGSVRRRLRSDVAVGASLSGGIDSSTILARILREPGAPETLPTFSAVFPGFEKDESAFIRLVADHFQQSNHSVTPTAPELIRDFETLAAHQEEPFQSSSIYAQYRVYALARTHGCKVLLDGQGADELLAGYPKYFPWYWRELYRQDRRLLAAELRAASRSGVPEKWNWRQRMAAILPKQAADFRRRSRIAGQTAHPDLSADFVRHAGLSYYMLPPVTELNGVLYYNALTNGLGELLRYADRNAMAHGVEIRLPFLDHRLAEFLFSLPARFKIRDGWSKWLLRRSGEPLLPPEITWRKDKIGYEPPQSGWMAAGPLQEYVREAKTTLIRMGVLDKTALQKKIQPMGAHAAENFDWRYLVTAACCG
ncbi:MAG TPA: asparagine synthase (glutamine-hydrolyzing) [Puia sp.]|nr:asparagine synthase (glutamine-hydrolyzing) [Puia sp.]